uniref:Uncharacterized protein n=1 Tax=Romanomermis culicivorax TaxID=13658 RepID=A0A915I0S5_ROMCU
MVPVDQKENENAKEEKNQMVDQEEPQEVIIADTPNVITLAVRSENAVWGEMEVVETDKKKPMELEALMDEFKEMKQKIEKLERGWYGREALELAKQMQGSEKRRDYQQ